MSSADGRRTAGPTGRVRLRDRGGDGGRDRADLTYAALDRRGRGPGRPAPGARARRRAGLLLYPPGLEFIAAFFGCLYAGVVAVPAYLPRPNRPMDPAPRDRRRRRPAAVLTTAALLPDGDAWSAQVPELAGLPRLATDAVDRRPRRRLARPRRDPGHARLPPVHLGLDGRAQGGDGHPRQPARTTRP